MNDQNNTTASQSMAREKLIQLLEQARRAERVITGKGFTGEWKEDFTAVITRNPSGLLTVKSPDLPNLYDADAGSLSDLLARLPERVAEIAAVFEDHASRLSNEQQ